jgi:hypothetical protein
MIHGCAQFGWTQQESQRTIQTAENAPVDPSFLLGLYNEVLLFSFLKHLVIVDKLLTVHKALHLHKFQLLLQHLDTSLSSAIKRPDSLELETYQYTISREICLLNKGVIYFPVARCMLSFY